MLAVRPPYATCVSSAKWRVKCPVSFLPVCAFPSYVCKPAVGEFASDMRQNSSSPFPFAHLPSFLALQVDLICLLRAVLMRTIRTFETVSVLADRVDTFSGQHMATFHPHRRICVCSLLLTDWTNKDLVKDHRVWQRKLHWHLVCRRPLCSLVFHDRDHLLERW